MPARRERAALPTACHLPPAACLPLRTVAVCGIKQIDPRGDGEVKHLLQLCIHPLLIAPQQLVALVRAGEGDWW